GDRVGRTAPLAACWGLCRWRLGDRRGLSGLCWTFGLGRSPARRDRWCRCRCRSGSRPRWPSRRHRRSEPGRAGEPRLTAIRRLAIRARQRPFNLRREGPSPRITSSQTTVVPRAPPEFSQREWEARARRQPAVLLGQTSLAVNDLSKSRPDTAHQLLSVSEDEGWAGHG